MPLYEYQCDACGNRFELIRKFSDPPLETCPKCGETGKIHKLVSSPAFQFKGSGWYVTDYARRGAGDPADTKKRGESGSAGKSGEEKTGAKADSKTESKTDTAPKDTTTTSSDKPAAPATTTTTTKDK